jgi:hypothetical protein
MLYLTTCVGFGYGPPRNIARGFSRQQRITDFTYTARHHVSPLTRHGFPCGAGHTLTPAQPPAGLSYLPASPHRSPTTHQDPTHPGRPSEDSPPEQTVSTVGLGVGRSCTGTGISTRSPSTTPLGLALGPDSPRAEQPAPGTLGHPAEGILTLHALLMPAFSLAPPPPSDPSTASPVARRSPTHPHTCTTRTPPDGGVVVWMPQLRRCA